MLLLSAGFLLFLLGENRDGGGGKAGKAGNGELTAPLTFLNVKFQVVFCHFPFNCLRLFCFVLLPFISACGILVFWYWPCLLLLFP